MRDLGYAGGVLWKSPAFTASALLTLALLFSWYIQRKIDGSLIPSGTPFPLLP
jgi:hypothetical protein